MNAILHRTLIGGLIAAVFLAGNAGAASGRAKSASFESLKRSDFVAQADVGQPEWLRLNLIPIDESLGLGSFICLGLGVGCYILVSNG